ncbi:MAG: tRNA (adenosine(37)-N6)-threonylcarbamoyltransferase complex transferase subunit TsaD [Patescibacteria group bacterium]
MTILAIETSCDETAIAVVGVSSTEQFTVLSNVVSSQVKLHAKYGGVVPNLASREHTKNISHVFESALTEAGIRDFEKEIDLIAVTHGPGLGPALLVGLTFARTLAWLYKKPLVGVNHLDGHVHANWLGREEPLPDIFPALNLLVSGGHTELVLMSSHSEYRLVGETLDDAVGEAFDKAARLLGLGYPGGPIIDRLAKEGNPDAYSLPRPMLDKKGFDFSYSGLKTAVLYLLRDLNIKKPSAQLKADIAASFQKAAIEVLVEKTMRAARHYNVKAILLSGGVSANKMLREQLAQRCTDASILYFQPPMEFTTDNAAMIAVAGYYSWKKNKHKAEWNKVSMNANLNFASA